MKPIDRYFDEKGVLLSWPSRKSRARQLAALDRLLEGFQEGHDYSEQEVDGILKSRIAFDDHVLVRRELIETGRLQRTRDCGRYWRPGPQDASPS